MSAFLAPETGGNRATIRELCLQWGGVQVVSGNSYKMTSGHQRAAVEGGLNPESLCVAMVMDRLTEQFRQEVVDVCSS